MYEALGFLSLVMYVCVRPCARTVPACIWTLCADVYAYEFRGRGLPQSFPTLSGRASHCTRVDQFYQSSWPAGSGVSVLSNSGVLGLQVGGRVGQHLGGSLGLQSLGLGLL